MAIPNLSPRARDPMQQPFVAEDSSSPLSSFSAPKTIEESNRAFLAGIRSSLPITYYIPTVQRNPELTSAQREIITQAFKLCRGLPQGNDQKTLSEVRGHFDELIHASNLLSQLQEKRDFLLYNRDHFDLKYRLAQSYAHLGSFDLAIKLLDEIISQIAQTECKLKGEDWDQQYLTFWNLSISLRASILAGPHRPLRSHPLDIPSSEMRRKFLIDSGAEFRKVGKDDMAANYYEKALLSKKIDPLTKNSLQRFLIDYYLEKAPLIMKNEPEKAIQMYEKALKWAPSQKTFNILLGLYTRQKAGVSSNHLIATRTSLLEKMIGLVSSYGDQQSKETLPGLRKELFECYLVYGKDCFKNQRFESAVASFEMGLEIGEREESLIDSKILNDLKTDLFNAFVSWSQKLESKGLIALASDRLTEALAFQRDHRLDVGVPVVERLLKHNEELSSLLKQPY